MGFYWSTSSDHFLVLQEQHVEQPWQRECSEDEKAAFLRLQEKNHQDSPDTAYDLPKPEGPAGSGTTTSAPRLSPWQQEASAEEKAAFSAFSRKEAGAAGRLLAKALPAAPQP